MSSREGSNCFTLLELNKRYNVVLAIYCHTDGIHLVWVARVGTPDFKNYKGVKQKKNKDKILALY